jgi:N-acetylmuramoyl-L-alanine amidase
LLLPYTFVSDFLPRIASGVTFDARAPVLQRQVASGPLASSRKTNRPVHCGVDAGHGGPDQRMHGPIGASWQMNEKDITLDVARRLRDVLRNAARP